MARKLIFLCRPPSKVLKRCLKINRARTHTNKQKTGTRAGKSTTGIRVQCNMCSIWTNESPEDKQNKTGHTESKGMEITERQIKNSKISGDIYSVLNPER